MYRLEHLFLKVLWNVFSIQDIYIFISFLYIFPGLCLHAIADSIFSLMNIFLYVFLCILESNKLYKYFLYL